MVQVGSKTRERVTAQIESAAEKIGAGVLACLAVAAGALLVAGAALVVSVLALRKGGA